MESKTRLVILQHWRLNNFQLQMTASEAGYAVLKTAFLRDRSWLPSYLTSIRTIFHPRFPESLFMLII